MDDTVKAEIQEIALGFDPEYMFNEAWMEEYLAPKYAQLKRRHPELQYAEFIEELTKAREQARKRA